MSTSFEQRGQWTATAQCLGAAIGVHMQALHLKSTMFTKLTNLLITITKLFYTLNWIKCSFNKVSTEICKNKDYYNLDTLWLSQIWKLLGFFSWETY